MTAALDAADWEKEAGTGPESGTGAETRVGTGTASPAYAPAHPAAIPAASPTGNHFPRRGPRPVGNSDEIRNSDEKRRPFLFRIFRPLTVSGIVPRMAALFFGLRTLPARIPGFWSHDSWQCLLAVRECVVYE